jgi:membrane dipeptidase
LQATTDVPDAATWASALSISKEAVELYLASEVIDLHVDSFIWHRVFGYDISRRHGHGLFGARYMSQVDFPRILEARIGGALWIITTNPARTSAGRARTFFRNLEELQRVLRSVPERFSIVRSAAEYRSARRENKHAALVGVQGGNALDHDLDDWRRIPERVVTLVTLVHLSSSRFGTTSSPLGRGDDGLTDPGRELVRRLNDARIFVDLAHISRQGFFDAVEVHDRSQPLIVSHTGVSGVYRHWRNVDDQQLRTVADTGGTVGVMYHSPFLGGTTGGGSVSLVASHLEHIVRTVGDDFASLGSDWDGAIVTPHDMPTCLELPRLVQALLDRGMKPESVGKILGENFLRALALLRG